MKKINIFIENLEKWYGIHKRSFPFRGSKNPYHIWVSEVLMQQTQIERGTIYYNRFIERFPKVEDLAQSSWEEFLPYFEGLGYYNRGRNMLKAAQIIQDQYQNIFPEKIDQLQKIPGIGPYTANAIASFAFDAPVVTVDTNIKRVIGRVFYGVSKLEHEKQGLKVLKMVEDTYKKQKNSSTINQAMMDLSSLICLVKKPKCLACPLKDICLYFQTGKYQQGEENEKRTIQKKNYTAKYPLAVIHYQKDWIVVFEGRLLGIKIKKGDERHSLKALAKEKLGIDISVRPAYEKWIIGNVQYALHNCYILKGEEKLKKEDKVKKEELENLLKKITDNGEQQAQLFHLD